jgi:hypothetical protein
MAMRAFIAAAFAVLILAGAASFVLQAFQKPVEVAFATAGARVD